MTRKKIFKWIFEAIAILSMLVMIGGYFVLRSSGFHHFVLAKIEQQAEEATGGRVEIKNYVFHFSKLSADVYGIVIYGTEKDPNHPLLALDQLSIDLKIISVLHHKVDLNEIILRHPVIHLISDKNGHSNIPQPNAPKQKQSNTNVFDLGIKHVLLANGEIYYNQQRTPMNAELHDLRTEITYDYLNSRYNGTISYRDGRLQTGDSKSLSHDLNASFTANPDRLSLSPALLRVGSSQARLEADVSDFANPKLDGTYQILIHMQDFQPLLKGSSVPAGNIALSGSLGYLNEPSQPLLRNVTLQGRLDSGELDIITPQARTAIRALHGNYRLANGNFIASEMGADLVGGHLGAEVSILHMDTTPTVHLRAVIRAISLRTAREIALSAQLKQIPVTGRIDGIAEASWTGSMQTLKARSDLMLKAAVAQGNSAKLVPVDGVVHVDYEGVRNVIALKDTFFRTPQTMIDVYGTVSNHSDFRIQARTRDLHELSNLAAALRQPGNVEPSNISNAPATLNVSGSANLSATMTGSLQNPRITGQLSAQNLQVQSGQFRSLQIAFQASPSGISIQHGSIIAARQGQAFFDVTVGLRDWKYLASNPITANLSLRQMPLVQLEELAKLNYPVTGILSADIYLRGSQLNPIGNGSAQITQAKAYSQQIQNLSLNFRALGDSVHSNLSVKTPAGGANGNLVFYPKTRGYQLQMTIPGLNLARLDAVQQRNVPVTGMLTLSAEGKGRLDNPQLVATVQIPQLQMRQASVKGIKAQMNVANHRAELAMDSQLLDSFVQARSTMNLTGDYYTVATLDTKGLPLAALIALYKPVPSQFQGEVEFHASAKGPLKDKSRMEAQLVVPTLRASYNQAQIGAARPIKIDYVNSLVSIEPSEIRGTGTSLQFAGQVPLKGSAPPKLNVQGNVDLQLIRIISPDVESSGQIALNLRATGPTTRQLGVQGQLRLQNISFSSISVPMGVENLNGIVDVEDNQVRITQLGGKLGGGEITGGGTITYKPQLLFNVALAAKAVRLRYPEGVRAMLDSNLTLAGNTQESSLNGRLLISSASFTPDFDLANFMSQFTGSSAPASPGQGFTQNLKLNIQVQTTSQLNVVSSQVSLQGNANLRVIGTAANPVIVGRTDFTGGEIFFMKKRYEIQRGIINFVNSNQTEPVVNVVLTTTVQQYNLSLTFLGPIDKLRTSYTSDPPLPPVDVINLLARGQTTEEATPGNLDANSVLAQGLASEVSGRLEKLAGLSSLTIDPTLGGNGTNPSARVALQQRVTRNFLFTFSTDVTNPQDDIVQGEYQLTKHWSVAATRDQYGGVAFDGKFRTVF
jgi:translocation and assembly module TamB